MALALAGMWQSCIDDESVGMVREISKINIEPGEDTLYVDFGLPQTIQPKQVTQTGKGNLTYKWGIGPADKINAGEISKNDSLKVISTEPVLHYAFPELGEFKLRLQVTNEDGSSFQYYTVFVRSAFTEGLLVLSEDEQRVGRSSFLTTKAPDEILSADPKDFILHAFEQVNPDVSFTGLKDIFWGPHDDDEVFILCEDGKTIRYYNRTSFDYLYSIAVNEEYPDTRLDKFCLAIRYLWTQFLGLGKDGHTWNIDPTSRIVIPDDKYFPGDKFDKIYFSSIGYEVLLVNFETSRIKHLIGAMYPFRTASSKEIFQGKKIIHLMGDDKNYLHVVTTEPDDDLAVTVTTFNKVMNGMTGWLQFTGAFENPTEESYRVERQTLTKDAVSVTNPKHYTTFYSKGNELYGWGYTGHLPVDPLHTFDGEITCMSLSPDDSRNYLYVGVWNPGAREELKGSIYVWDITAKKVIREFKGVADKPLNILYKN